MPGVRPSSTTDSKVFQKDPTSNMNCCAEHVQRCSLFVFGPSGVFGTVTFGLHDIHLKRLHRDAMDVMSRSLRDRDRYFEAMKPILRAEPSCCPAIRMLRISSDVGLQWITLITPTFWTHVSHVVWGCTTIIYDPRTWDHWMIFGVAGGQAKIGPFKATCAFRRWHGKEWSPERVIAGQATIRISSASVRGTTTAAAPSPEQLVVVMWWAARIDGKTCRSLLYLSQTWQNQSKRWFPV